MTEKIVAVRSRLTDLQAKTREEALRKQIDALQEKLQSLNGGGVNRRPDPAATLSVASTLTKVRTLFNILQEADVAPTPQVMAAVAAAQKDSQSLAARWQVILAEDLPGLNQKLQAAGLATIDPAH